MRYDGLSRDQLIKELLLKDQLIKKMQSDLKKLELIFNHTRIGIVIGSADGKTLDYMNPAFAEMHGYTVEELTGKPLQDVFDPDFRPKLPYITELVHEKGIYSYECKHLRKDGTLFPVLVEAIAVYGGDGTVLYRIVNVRDLTQQKKQRKAADKVLNKYRLLYKQIRDLVLFISLDGKIVEANDSALKAYGYTRDELLKKTIYDLRCSEPVQLIREQMMQAEKEGITFETMHCRKDGSAFPVEVSSKNADIDGERMLLSIIRDISERKRMEEALQESEKEKTLILNGISEIVIYCDLEMRIIWSNRAASVFTGLTREQLKGRRCHEVFFNTYISCTNCSIKKALLTGQPVDGKIKKIMGKTIFTRGYPVLDQNETVTGLVFVMTDLTERKRIENALRESENKFKTVYESAIIGITLVNLDGKIMESNKAFQIMLGFSAHELKGMSCSDITYEEDHELNDQLFEELVTGRRKYFQTEKRYRRKDGRVIWVRMNASTVKDDNGEISYIIGVVEDVTRQKLAEEALRASEEKYRMLFHNANDAIFLYGIRDNSMPDRFIEVNDVACERLGYSRGELLTMNLIDLNPADKHKYILNFVSYVIENRFGMTETIHMAKTGVKIPVEVNSHLFHWGNEKVILSIVRDISERKKSEAELAEARMKANRAERLASLGTLAAGIAHEINQPLNSIKIIADSLLYWYSEQRTLDINDVVEDLNKISQQTGRIGNIINRLRSFVAGEHKATLDYCDLNEAVEDALNMIGGQLSAHGINVKKVLFHPLPLIRANKQKLEEVVINVTINAMQALDTIDKPDKKILIATSFDKNVILKISDNATGIDESNAHKIFEPFFTTKEVGVGMGLGLSIVHSIVTSFRGQIFVEENNMGGATFKIEFPAQ